MSDLWTVSAADLRGLEAKLAAEIRRHLGKDIPPESPLGIRLARDTAEYRVQAVGILRGRRRMTYLNGFAHVEDSDLHQMWRIDPVIVCDGGHGYFGAVYDPTAGELSKFAFNGVG